MLFKSAHQPFKLAVIYSYAVLAYAKPRKRKLPFSNGVPDGIRTHDENFRSSQF